MTHRKLVFSTALALALAATAVGAQTTPAAPAPAAANPVDPASIQALKDMGAYLQTLQRFRASTTLTGERVLADGQKLMHSASATVEAQRPDKLRARMRSVRSQREIVYDGKLVTLYDANQKYYSTAEFSEPTSVLVGKLEERYGIEIPMSDLFTWGTPAAPIDKIESAMNVGQDVVGGAVCDHYAFRQAGYDWQIWIETAPRLLPRKIVITNRGDEARPQSVTLMDWNVKPAFNEATFKFTPPAGAKKIELVPVKSK